MRPLFSKLTKESDIEEGCCVTRKNVLTEVMFLDILKEWTETELKEYAKKYNAVTIPVQVEILGKQRVLNLKEVERILAEAKLIALGECYCRKKIKGCNSPLDTCLSLNEKAKELISRDLAVEVNLKDALKTLKRAHEVGLVHITYSIAGKEKPEYICSCCSCCCHSLSGLVKFGLVNAVVSSEYIASNDMQSCISCGKCVQRCPFKARTLQDGKMRFDKTRCFGCGLCATTCPTGSISLVLRRNDVFLRKEQNRSIEII
jgi:Pyruvate/2-oxoacid:ferredoxin oxidoreductase delta subunit